jgi:hypothetical protein
MLVMHNGHLKHPMSLKPGLCSRMQHFLEGPALKFFKMDFYERFICQMSGFDFLMEHKKISLVLLSDFYSQFLVQISISKTTDFCL